MQTSPAGLRPLSYSPPAPTGANSAQAATGPTGDRVDLSVPAGPLPPFVHSHNDYLRPHPLQDALSAGANSVEADVHLQKDITWHWPGLSRLVLHHDLGFRRETRFIVGHNYVAAAFHEETLQQMYLEPLQQKIDANGGKLPGGPLTLMIELKSGNLGDSNPSTMYANLKPLLEKYSSMLTHYDHGKEVPGQVSVVITGARLGPVRADMENSPVRYAAMDGGLGDLKAQTSPMLIPQVSTDWKTVFQWNGQGAMPASQQQHLRDLTQQGRERGIRVRFWDAPDAPNTWQQLVDAGAEVNTDHPIQFHQWYEQFRAGVLKPL